MKFEFLFRIQSTFINVVICSNVSLENILTANEVYSEVKGKGTKTSDEIRRD